MNINDYNLIFAQYRMQVFNFCNKLVNDRYSAEDVTILVFLSLWKHLAEVEPDSLKAYLMITAKRKCLDHLKATRKYNIAKKAHGVQDEIVFNDARIEVDVMQRIIAIIDTLPPRESQVIKMKYLEGMKQGEIAHKLGINVQSVANTITNGLKKLRPKFVNVKLFDHE